MSTALDLDIAALVGEMESIPCEHHQHKTRPAHTDEPASHYASSHCDKCGFDGVQAAAICPGYVRLIRSGAPLQCIGCRRIAPAFDLITILGPIGGQK